VVVADHAELPAVSRLVIGVRLAAPREGAVMQEGQGREDEPCGDGEKNAARGHVRRRASKPVTPMRINAGR